MNILLVGGGGREHALAWKLAQSPSLTKLFAAPGNPGIAAHAELVPLNIADKGAVVAFCGRFAIDLVVIGPEQPLVDGLADALRDAGVAAFGPGAAAAQLEGSKGFTKDLCAQHNIPTAGFERVTGAEAALAAVGRFGAPAVIKADGLAAGKGVVVAMTLAEAEAAARDLDGEAVIEQFLEGEEASLFVLTDGKTARVLGSAQDHKRVGEGDTGPNTGGMGAYSPATVLTPELEARAMREIVEPTVKALAAAGTPFIGVLYAGLMLTPTGPQLIEYNARFGDPETQVLMPRITGDLARLLNDCATGKLAEADFAVAADTALTVVIAAEGYPGEPRKGGAISGIDAAEADESIVFQAGTRLQDGHLVASGGRVLAVTATGADVNEAAARAYRAVERIDFADGFYRRDIGWREIVRLNREGL
ncbi:MAG TPA: phosphoribosylamine--glycine ligase [Sphingomonas sp.]|nr:phosphoribosylamine--glycine ligase [Sphingomonas sp.]